MKVGMWSDFSDLFDYEKSRDQCFYRWFALKQRFKNEGIEFETFSLKQEFNKFDIIIELDYQGFNHNNKYLIMNESPVVCPENWDSNIHSYYKKIFCWDDGLLDDKKYFKQSIGHLIPNSIPKNFEGKKLCCTIAGNKRPKISHPDELYSHRINFIRWFERHHPNEFDLYGTNWDQFRFGHSTVGRILNKFTFLRKTNQYPSYRGKVESKFETMKNYKFSICYENVKDTNGYISEKIFDSFTAGCVPVYWGSKTVTNYIPKKCFIDRRDFDNFEEIFKFMKTMSKSEYFDYLENIEGFLNSEKADVFRAETFANTIVETIVGDLSIANN